MRRNVNHNESGVFNARQGKWKGRLCLFTHKCLEDGTVFLERYLGEDGKMKEPDNPWIREEEIEWMEE